MLDKKEEPLYPLNDFHEEWDEANHLSNVRYFDNHPSLITKIQVDLKRGNLRWDLDGMLQRLCFVPEKREKFASLFEDYCRNVINYVLTQTGLSNPYFTITTSLEEKPEIPLRGIKVFLVHNLAKESIAT